ncbi:MAG: hypothetical protein EOM59_11650 [Clostridia bacterium]|nr:hypothetical protein [Clostridia bacterium]
MRKVIQVKEEDFKKDKYGDIQIVKGKLQISVWHVGGIRSAFTIWIGNGSHTEGYDGKMIEDGVKAINAALQEMFEDISEEQPND